MNNEQTSAARRFVEKQLEQGKKRLQVWVTQEQYDFITDYLKPTPTPQVTPPPQVIAPDHRHQYDRSGRCECGVIAPGSKAHYDHTHYKRLRVWVTPEQRDLIYGKTTKPRSGEFKRPVIDNTNANSQREFNAKQREKGLVLAQKWMSKEEYDLIRVYLNSIT